MNFPKVINYHAILSPRKGPSWKYDSIYVTSLSRQLKLLSRYYNILHPKEVLFRIKEGQEFGRRDILLTFDDGYQNNLDLAAPILRSLGITALIFLNTKNLNGEDLLWFNWLKLFKQRNIISQNPIGIEGMSYSEISKQIDLYKMDISKLSEQEVEQFIGAKEQDLVKIVREGIFVPGGHTTDHPKLTAESKKAVVDQIKENRTYLKRLFNREIDFFAYPQGLLNEEVIQVVKECGYKAAFVVSKYNNNQGVNHYTIPRIGIYRGGVGYLLVKLLFNVNR
ncbi:MAG: polysaccharide deacetylase family protein [Bacteroidia bacterium]